MLCPETAETAHWKSSVPQTGNAKHFTEAQKQALSTEYMWNAIPFQRLNLGQGCQNPPSSILFWKTVQFSASWCNTETSYSTERNARPKLINKIWETWAADLAPEDVSVYWHKRH